MRIGCVTWALEGATVVEAVRAAVDAGLQAVSFLHTPQENLSANEQAELDRLMEKADLVATMHTAVEDPNDPDARAALERRLALAREWHERKGRLACVTFDSFSVENDGARILDLRTNAERIRSTIDVFAAMGVRVGIENSPKVLNTTASLRELAAAVGWPEAGFHLDLGHLNMDLHRNGYDPVRFVRDCPFEIIELHVHDNDGESDQHLPLGQGNIELAPILAALKARGFDGIATLENCGLKSYAEAVEEWRRGAAVWREVWG